MTREEMNAIEPIETSEGKPRTEKLEERSGAQKNEETPTDTKQEKPATYLHNFKSWRP